MSTITAVLEPHEDGAVRLPVPAELRGGPIRFTATLEAARPAASGEMLRGRREAFEKLRQLNPFRALSDPGAWQKELRRERPLPGRE